MTEPTSTIFYDRVSTTAQSKKSQSQRHLTFLASRFPNSTLHYACETCAGAVPLHDRPIFLAQHRLAQQSNLPLWLDHADRLLKSFDTPVIASAHSFLSAGGVPLQFLHRSSWIHTAVRSLWASRSPRSARLLVVVQQLRRYLSWRSALLGSRSPGASVAVPDPLPWEILRLDPYLPDLSTCADLVLDLVRLPDLPVRLFYLDAYLGALFNQVAVHRRAVRARRRAFSPGQRTYGERPADLRLFATVARLESVALFTGSGKPKRVSDQSIATQLNALGFRNLRGRPFSRKNTFDLRRSPGYLAWKSALVLVPELPTLDELRS
jgi:hypothetical protein